MEGEERVGERGREGEGTGRSTCLPPRFDIPAYGPVSIYAHVGKTLRWIENDWHILEWVRRPHITMQNLERLNNARALYAKIWCLLICLFVTLRGRHALRSRGHF